MSHNKFYGIDDSEFEQIESPLKAIHEIDRQLNQLASIAVALNVVGIGISKDVFYLLNNLRSLSKNVEDGIMRESNKSYQESKESTNKLIGMALTSCLETKSH